MFARINPSTHLMAVVLAALLLATGAEARNPVAPPGSRVAILVPEGYDVARGFTGFKNDSLGASIVITELKPGSMVAVRGTYGDSEGPGVRRLSHSELPKVANPGFLSVYRSVEGRTPFRKWVLAFDAPTLTGIVAINVPESAIDPAREAEIVAALASVTIVPNSAGVGGRTPPFRLGASSGLRPVAARDGTTLILADDSEDEPATRFSATAHMGGEPVLAPAAFSRGMAMAVDGIDVVAPEEAVAIAADGIDGFEVSARCVDVASKAPCVLYHAMLFGGDGYYRFVGIASEARQNAAMVEFRGLVQGFRRQP